MDADPLHQTTDDLSVYTREEMREACQNNWNAALDRAAQVAMDAMGGYLCPYGRDKPGGPTWDHTDKDICPVCGGNGETSLFKCHDTVSGRIAAGILALKGRAHA